MGRAIFVFSKAKRENLPGLLVTSSSLDLAFLGL